ncbi:hypothetical protein MIU24_03100 [Streptomyces venezuelae]|uniref:hypothetical protein n=1 Tax=Streptomyces sp. B6(2022) TaxID=3404749 RepID=UPI00311DB3EA
MVGVGVVGVGVVLAVDGSSVKGAPRTVRAAARWTAGLGAAGSGAGVPDGSARSGAVAGGASVAAVVVRS